MRLRWMTPGSAWPSAGTARCWDQVFFPLEGSSHEIKMDEIRYFSPEKVLSHEIKMDEARFCLAFSRDSEMLGSGIFSPVKGLYHEIKMDDARICLAVSRDSEMLGSGIFLL